MTQLPRNHVFHPSQVVLLHCAGQFDATVDADVAVMIGRERYLHSDDGANLGDIFGEYLDALVGDLNTGERMHDARAAADVGSGGARERAGDVAQQADAEILLQKRDALIHSRFQAFAGHCAVGMPVLLEQLLAGSGFGRVGIEARLVAEFAAQHLIGRNAVSLASQIPQGHLNAAYAAGLARRRSELFNLAENLVHVAWVFAEDARLERYFDNTATT